MNLSKNLLFQIVIVIIIVIVGTVFYTSQPKIAYINLNKLYNEFSLKKEMEKKLTNIEQGRQHILDSLEASLKIMNQMLSKDLQIDKNKISIFEEKRQEYLNKKTEYSQDNSTMVEQYAGQVAKQLNQYLEEYGKENGYEFILGTDGTGSVMFASEKLNITEKVSDYINKKYKGI